MDCFCNDKIKRNKYREELPKGGVIRIRKSKKDRQHNSQKKDRQHNSQKKDRQHNSQKKTDKMTNNDLQNTT